MSRIKKVWSSTECCYKVAGFVYHGQHFSYDGSVRGYLLDSEQVFCEIDEPIPSDAFLDMKEVK